jgi:hypothetical protein
MTALAGCSGLDIGGDDQTVDTAGLGDLRREDVPRPPATFPVSVPDAMVARHRDRARELVDRVPARPEVPNGAVAERLRRDRESVLDRLGEDGVDARGPAGDPLRPLDAARIVRGEAAAVEAAYRAATDAITRTDVADRRSELRSALFEFERDWTYRGDDPAAAVVMHRALEGLRLDARPGIAPDRPFPDDPSTDALRVGELVHRLEIGRAALSDARRLRTRYRERLSDPRPYRTAISVAADRIRRLSRQYSRDLEGYTDPDPEELPFDRSVEGTPLERLYVRAIDGVEIFRTDAAEARHRGDHATVVIEAGITLTVLRALESIVADIRNDRVTVPETVDGVVETGREAFEALESAWSTAPRALSTEVAHWSQRLVYDVPDRLSGPAYEPNETPDAGDAYDVWAIYVTAARVAAAVPRTVSEIRAALRTATA